jgi:hypothetical protein
MVSVMDRSSMSAVSTGISSRRENGAPKVPSVSVTTWKQIHGGGGRTGRLCSYVDIVEGILISMSLHLFIDRIHKRKEDRRCAMTSKDMKW